MSSNLTEKEIKDISLGYNWNPNMGYDEFIKMNPDISYDRGWDLYQIIDNRYCAKISEKL